MRKFIYILATLLLAGSNTAWCEDVSTWAGLQAIFTNGGEAKLTADIIAASYETRLSITGGKTVTLDLNGHKLSRGLTNATKKNEGQVIYINNGTLTITDSDTSTSHTITIPNGTDGGDGSVDISGGVITGGYTHSGSSNQGNGGGIHVDEGTLNLQGGTICGNQATGGSGSSSSYGIGGGIYLQSGCTFTMSGNAAVKYNNALITGGVHCRKNCRITITGREITYNKSAYKAGGLAINSGTGDTGYYKLSGAVVIKENENNSGANNLFLYNISNKKIQIDGGLAGTDIGVSWGDSGESLIFTQDYTAKSGSADVAFFSVDDTNYEIALDNGELKITNKSYGGGGGGGSSGDVLAYAVLDGTTFTFYYDDQKNNRSGTYCVDGDEDGSPRNWITPGTGVAVDGVKNITSAVFDESFASYAAENGDNWFHGCSSLTSITALGNFKVTGTHNISWMFAGCSSLSSIDLSNWDTSGIYHFNNLFNGCTALTNVTIGPNFSVDASLISTNSGTYADMFKGCTRYTNATGTIIISGTTVPDIELNIFSDISLGKLSASSLTKEALGVTSDLDGLFHYKGGTFLEFNGKRTFGLNNLTVTETVMTYTGEECRPTVTIIHHDGTNANAVVDPSYYDVIYGNNIENGIATVTILGKGIYEGASVSKTFIIQKEMSHSDIVVLGLPDAVWNDGSTAQTPTFTVVDRSTTLTEGVHYTVAYADNTAMGQATITLTGKNDAYYTGTRTIHFLVLHDFDATMNGQTMTFHPLDLSHASIIGFNNTAYSGVMNINNAIVYETYTFTITGIGSDVFKNCSKITGINLPARITSIGGSAFSGCTALRYMDMNDATGFTPISFERDASITDAPFSGIPLQALVYLNSTDIRGENYVYKPGSGNDYFCELFKVYDDTSGSQTEFSETNGYRWEFENRHNFTAYTIENTRQLTAGKHYTIFLPYDFTLPSTLKAYTLNGANDTGTVGFTEVTGTLGPNTTNWLELPYVVIPSESGQLLNTTNAIVREFKEENISNKNELNGKISDNFTLYGNMRYMEGNDAVGLYIMQYNAGNPTWMQIQSGAGFNETNRACVLPMRAYIKYNGGGGARPRLSAVFNNGDGSTTAIDDLRLNPEDSDCSDNSELFDLQGRRVTSPPSPGIYIRNGKKTLHPSRRR